MNWMALIGGLPYIIAGIQQLHGNSIAGADKKTLALQSLGLAESVAGGVLTGQNAQYAAVAGSVIDTLVNSFKVNSLFGFKPSAPVAVSGAAAVTGAVVTGK